MIDRSLHGLRDLIVFITILRLIFVQGSWKQDLQLMMVSLHSGEIFRLLLLLRVHWNNKLIRRLGVFVSVVVEEWPTDHICSQSVLHVSTVYQSPCLCSRSHHVEGWGCSVSPPTVANIVEPVPFAWGCSVSTTSTCLCQYPFTCVFTDLFSVIDGRNHALECVCDILLLYPENSLCLSFNPLIDSWTLNQGWLGVKLCCSITIWSGNHSVPVSAREINLVLHLTSMLRISIENLILRCLHRQSSSSFLEKSLSVVWLTQDVIFVLLLAVSSATASFVEASSSNLCQVFWATLTPCDLVHQINELKNSLLENVYRQLENSLFGLSGSRQNLSLYRNRIISNFVNVHWICDISMCWFTWLSISLVALWCSFTLAPGRRARTCSPNGRTSFLYFCHTRFKNRRFPRIHCCIDKHRIFSIERRRLAQASQVLDQLCIVHLFGIR